jgi:CubicO group peptidase (beta-lactamase class C family)
VRRTKTLKLWCLLTLTLVVSCASLNQESVLNTIPGTPAGRRLSAVLSIINSGDYAAMTEYVAESFSRNYIGQSSISRHVNGLMRLHTNRGELEFHNVSSSSRYRIVCILKETLMDKYMTFGITVEKRKPFAIDSIFYGPADSYASDNILTEGQIVSRMESLLDMLAMADVYSGVVLIAKDDRVLLQKAYGYASRDPKVSNTIDTRFNMGSIGKLFTTVAVAQLFENGELSLDDPVAMYLGPDWILEEIGEEVKIKHLLTHTSGLGDYLENPQFQAAAKHLSTLNDHRLFVVDEQLLFEPGSRKSYSNTGFLLLGAIVEKVSGQSYQDYLKMRVFEPAGMAVDFDVVFVDGEFPAPNFAIGYSIEYSEQGVMWKDNIGLLDITRAGPAGGGHITAGDLFRFSAALKKDLLIAEETKSLFWGRNPEPNAPHHGYGFQVETRKGETMIGHGGSHDGFGAMLRLYLNSGYTFIVFSNSGRMMAFSLTEKFTDLVL